MLRTDRYQVPRSASMIGELLDIVSVARPDRAGYLAISQIEGARFAEALASVANGDDHDGQLDKYVRAIVAAALPEAREVCRMAGFPEMKAEALVSLATREGLSLANTLKSATDNPADSVEALYYLRRLLEEDGYHATDDVNPHRPQLAVDQNADERAIPANPPPIEALVADDRQRSRPESLDKLPPTQKRWGASNHVYGGSAALCFSETRTKEQDRATVTIEAAPRDKGGKCRWSEKVSLMLTPSELPLVLGFFLGKLERLELKGHGQAQEKAMTFVDQGDSYFLTLITRGRPPLAVPVPARDGYGIITMLISQMLQNDPFLSAEQVIQLTGIVCARHAVTSSRSK